MHFWLSGIILILSSIASAQFMPVDSMHVSSNSVWELDALGNVLVADGELITKYDTTGKVWAKQSVKSIGRVEEMFAINSMRTLVFSENQQLFLLLDNTLTPVNNSYDLSELGFGYVSMIAPSAQPKKVWLYDQLNSTLVLFDWARTGQQQRIENIQGILGASDFVYFKESNNNLHLIDEAGKYFVLDRYGALIRETQLASFEDVCIEDGNLCLLSEDRWKTQDKNGKWISFPEPLAQSVRIRIERNVALGQQGDLLIKYSKKK